MREFWLAANQAEEAVNFVMEGSLRSIIVYDDIRIALGQTHTVRTFRGKPLTCINPDGKVKVAVFSKGIELLLVPDPAIDVVQGEDL